MARKFKFRVYDILNKKMLKWGDIFDLPAWEIFPGTPEQRPYNVMQYTGIRDKNEKEIYEGDIIKFYSNELIVDRWIGKVYFDFGAFIVKASNAHEISIADDLGKIDVDDQDLEVIGNIYENPEILEL